MEDIMQKGEYINAILNKHFLKMFEREQNANTDKKIFRLKVKFCVGFCEIQKSKKFDMSL